MQEKIRDIKGKGKGKRKDELKKSQERRYVR